MTLRDQLSVLFVCQHDFDGPTEKQALGFAQQLVRRGHRVAFSLGGDAAGTGASGAAMVDRMTVFEHRLVGRGLRTADTATARAFGPDLIHCLNPRAPTVAAARVYASATGAPVLVHFEDDDWRFGARLAGEPLKTHVGHVIRRGAAPWRPAAWPHASSGTLHHVARAARSLDALTPALGDEVARRTKRDCSVLLPVTPQLEVQPENGFALPLSLEGTPLALFTGTLYPVYRNDVELGLRAVGEVQRRGYKLAYLHAGRVHARIDPAALARAAGLQPGTAVFAGLLPYASIPPLLARASVLLQPGAPSDFNRLRLPSKMQAYLESGTPTVTFSVGFGELLEDRREVLKTYTADPDELADRIVELLEDRELRARLSTGGIAAARRLFDPVANTDKLEAHYRAALSGDRA